MLCGLWMGNNRIRLEEDKDGEFDDLMFLSKETLISMLRKNEKEINSLMQSRKKWKYRYYKMKNKNKDLQKSVEQIYDDYQDIGKMDFDYSDKLEQKDKIIDLMAEEISKNITNTCPFADYNYDLDCENKCNDNYKECWKQYFENKVKEGKK